MNILKKDDLYFNATQNDWVTVMDIVWAYKHYAHMDEKQLKEYWQKKGSISIFLLDIEDIGEKAFQYFVKVVIEYIQEQSIYWDESFEVFDDRPIDDDAVSAFESFPRVLHRRFIEKNGKLNQENYKVILEFIDWALYSLDSFNKEIFLAKETTREEHQRLRDDLFSFVSACS